MDLEKGNLGAASGFRKTVRKMAPCKRPSKVPRLSAAMQSFLLAAIATRSCHRRVEETVQIQCNDEKQCQSRKVKEVPALSVKKRLSVDNNSGIQVWNEDQSLACLLVYLDTTAK